MPSHKTIDAPGVPGAVPVAKRTDWTLAYILIAAVGGVGVVALVSSPVTALLGDSSYAIPSTMHGVTAILYVIVATITAYLGFLLYTGRLEAHRDLRILAGLSSFLSLVTILFGNWIYIAYRAKGDSAKNFFLQNSPVVHEIFFEFKEFIALFTLPLTIAAAYVLWSRRDELRDQKDLRQAVAIVLILAWACLMLAFGLGAAITKLRSV